MLALSLKYVLENEMDTGNGWANGVDHRKPVTLSTEARSPVPVVSSCHNFANGEDIWNESSGDAEEDQVQELSGNDGEKENDDGPDFLSVFRCRVSKQATSGERAF
jgi:hypothetical protein